MYYAIKIILKHSQNFDFLLICNANGVLSTVSIGKCTVAVIPQYYIPDLGSVMTMTTISEPFF